MKALLVAMCGFAIGCSGRATRLPPEDAPAGDNQAEQFELAGKFDRKCVGGDLEACRKLAVMYAEGTVVSPDRRRAAQLFNQACLGGNRPACHHYAAALAEGVGVEPQPQKAADLYQKTCDGGHLLACRNLGLMLRDGRGIAVDLTRAQGLLDKACKGGVPLACTSAGDIDALRAQKGSVARYYKDMVAHYKLGCETGDPTACRQLGIAYLEGKGLPKSASAAALWLERACLPDDPVGCRLLGVMKLEGNGIARDLERGTQLLVRACNARDDEACRLLRGNHGNETAANGGTASIDPTGASPRPAGETVGVPTPRSTSPSDAGVGESGDAGVAITPQPDPE